MMVGNALASALTAGRAQFNQRFRAVQLQHANLDPQVWLAFLRDTLDPIAESVAHHDAHAVNTVVDALYDEALPLVAKRWLGAEAREPVLAASYRELLVAFAPALVQDPARLSGSLLNALHQLCQTDPLRAQLWSARFARLGDGLANIETLLALGRILAWRVGWPAYREAALQAAPRLPAALVQAALELRRAPTPALWAALAAHSTLSADQVGSPAAAEMRWLGWCGGFRGLGGPFAGMPQLGLAAGALAASDGVDTWRLFGDGYGTQALRIGTAEDWPLAATGSRVKVSAEGSVSAGAHTRAFPELATATGCAWYAGLLAVTLRTSYRIALIHCPLP